ncbi:hypothetical protein ACQCX2_07650 [Propionibacteriaceae bacterium Y1700]|uniref:hypothetical protein n=1 Tax=Microlunatus sp. Y1700 TaxID=3418487 RepID=UPI003DA79C4E
MTRTIVLALAVVVLTTAASFALIAFGAIHDMPEAVAVGTAPLLAMAGTYIFGGKDA